ncbi:MAG TPA: hypothetical protein VNG70_11330 [Candidatus Limnocylindria bacterium]|nr:hypothetical protein [Candidatus Limnocylindria bacterium]
MTRRRLVIVVLVVVVLATGSVAFANYLGGGPAHHLDGQGILGSSGDPGSIVAVGFDPIIGGPTWSVGLELCLTQSGDPAVLDGSVAPTKTFGSGFQYLGAFVRQFKRSEGSTPMISVDGFPPQVPDPLHPVHEYSVNDRCQHPKTDRSAPYTELVLGFGRGTETGGGGWMGVDVGYTSGGHHHVVSLGYYFMICGPAAPPQYCGGPT